MQIINNKINNKTFSFKIFKDIGTGQKKNINIQSLHFSGSTSSPNNLDKDDFQKSSPSRFKQIRDQLMIKIVNNEQNIQEKILFFHILFLIGFSVVLFPIKVFLLTLFFILNLFLIYRIYNYISEKIKENKNYQTLAISIGILVLLYNENYTLLALYVYILIHTLFKKFYIATTEKETVLVKYWKDLDTMAYHLNYEFRLFFEVQKFNLFLLLSYIYSIYLESIKAIPVTSFWTKEIFMQAQVLILIIFLLNFFLFLTIRIIITRYCNPKFHFPHISEMGTIASGGAATIGALLGLRHQALNDPIPYIPGTYLIQDACLDFRADTIEELVAGRQHRSILGTKPPCDINNKILLPECLQAIQNYNLALEIKKEIVMTKINSGTYGNNITLDIINSCIKDVDIASTVSTDSTETDVLLKNRTVKFGLTEDIVHESEELLKDKK